MPFSSIVGHGPLRDLLRQAVRRGRVPQSLLFAGPDGVGKRAMATALAQAVNCPHVNDGDACGACPVCSRITRGTFSDVVWLEKGTAASVKIEVLRERLLDVVGYRPFEGKKRVYIIEPADDLTVQSQDALLKTLEEPPSAAILILISAYADTLLPTIQSRCRRVRFGLLSEEDVARVLIERNSLDATTARRLAAVSGGSVSRALSEQAGSFDDDRNAALNLLRASRGTAMAERLKASAAFVQHGTKRRDREAMSARLSILASLLRDLGALASGTAIPLANTDLDEVLRGMSQTFDGAHVVDAFGAVDHAEMALGRNASPKIVADWLVVRL